MDSLGKETRRDVHRIAVRGRNLSARAVENSHVCRILHTTKSCDVRPSLGMLRLFPAASSEAHPSVAPRCGWPLLRFWGMRGSSVRIDSVVMRTSRLIFALSIAASFGFLVACQFRSGDWPVILEVSSIVLLAVLGFRADWFLGGALLLSAVGDFLLGVGRLGQLEGESLFLLGLGSFLIAHLVYIAMFRGVGLMDLRKVGAARACGVMAIVVALAVLLGGLRPTLGDLLIPVVVYAVVLGAMAISAVLADLGTPLAGVGALFFIASDAMLAVGKFRGPFPGSAQLIWITYYLAQALILQGVVRRPESGNRGILQRSEPRGREHF